MREETSNPKTEEKTNLLSINLLRMPQLQPRKKHLLKKLQLLLQNLLQLKSRLQPQLKNNQLQLNQSRRKLLLQFRLNPNQFKRHQLQNLKRLLNLNPFPFKLNNPNQLNQRPFNKVRLNLTALI